MRRRGAEAPGHGGKVEIAMFGPAQREREEAGA